MKKIDIYRSANILIKQHDDKALETAFQKMTALMEAGDYEAALIWHEVTLAISELTGAREVEETIH